MQKVVGLEDAGSGWEARSAVTTVHYGERDRALSRYPTALKWLSHADLGTFRQRRRRRGNHAQTRRPLTIRQRRAPVPYSREMTLPCRLLASLLAVWVSAPMVAAAAQAPAAGRVKAAIGSASIVRGGQAVAAAVGMEVFASDRLRTGSDGRLALTLKDDTRLSLGPDTEVSLDEFAFAPAEGRLSMVLRMVKGALSYISGRIARLRPSSVRLETPSSVIAVRGTHVLIHVEAP